MTFGAKLRKTRLDQRRTLAAVAADAGMSTQRLAEVETSPIASTSALNVVRLANALGLDPVKLLRLAKPKDFTVWRRVFASVKCDRQHVEAE